MKKYGLLIIIAIFVLTTCKSIDHMYEYKQVQKESEYPEWLKRHSNWGIKVAKNNIKAAKDNAKRKSDQEKLIEKINELNEKAAQIKQNN